MSLETEYKRILDESFGKHFSGWDSLSPLDPLKVLSEAMTSSLGEIERRQRNYVSGLMDSLPSLCGFAPKGAELPMALLKFQPVARLNESKTFPVGTSFRFQKDESACHALTSNEFAVAPIYDLTSRTEGASVQVDFRYQGVSSELVLQFAPEPEGTVTQLSGVRVDLMREGAIEKAFDAADLTFSEDTAGFRRFGALVVRRREKESLLFEQATQTVRVTLTFDRKAPQGEITSNVVACRLAQVEDSFVLGVLTGEPWEEISLPESLTEVPAECYLSFSDEKTVVLKRQETSFLDLKHANYEMFKGAFFYNGANHSLIVPAADELVGNYNGRVQVYAQSVLLRPGFEALSPEYQGRAGDASATVEKVSVYRPLSSFLPRETKRSYLARFYAAMGAIQTQPTAALNSHDIQQKLLSLEPELRAVETQFDANESKLFVYLLASNPMDDQATHLSSALLARVSLRLSQLLPLTVRWQIQPFRFIPVTLSLQARCAVQKQRSSVGEAQDCLTARVNQWLLPTPFGGLHCSTNYRLQDLADTFEVEKVSGVVAKSGILSDSLLREPGEILAAEIKMQVNLQAQQVSHVA